ncbi:MAG TPA: nicotinate-nucleotide adenylyltransferase [Xanthomonadales bacterium]
MTHRDPSAAGPLAFFGGTFDPVHYGHLRCADEARQKLGLKNLYLLPAGTPPHRDAPQASVKQRLDMLELARKEFPHLLIDDRETRRSGPSYMVDTLRELRSEFPDQPLLLLVGQDVANHLHRWFQWQRLFDLAHIVVLTRPASHTAYEGDLAKQVRLRSVSDFHELFKSRAGAVVHLEVEPIEVSATAIKSIIGSNKRPASMLPAAVLEYIIENRLYLQEL